MFSESLKGDGTGTYYDETSGTEIKEQTIDNELQDRHDERERYVSTGGVEPTPQLQIGYTIGGPIFSGSKTVGGGYSNSQCYTSWWGISVDIIYGSGAIEVGIGASKYLGVGFLSDYNDGKLKLGGAAIHIGIGKSTPITISFSQ